jgi:hypothetical protein
LPSLRTAFVEQPCVFLSAQARQAQGFLFLLQSKLLKDSTQASKLLEFDSKLKGALLQGQLKNIK